MTPSGSDRLDFQTRAARQIAARYARHAAERPAAPFFQALALVTVAGKTVVLGDAVSLIAEAMPVAPLVLWLSRGRVLAQNTYNALRPGGRHGALLPGEVRPL